MPILFVNQLVFVFSFFHCIVYVYPPVHTVSSPPLPSSAATYPVFVVFVCKLLNLVIYRLNLLLKVASRVLGIV